MLTADQAMPAEATSENNDRLKRVLKRFPKADADRDGALTVKEARAFWANRRKGRGRMQNDGQVKGPAPTFADVKYGPHQLNVLDFWRAESKIPTPVVVFIHGGGFRGGDKRKVRQNPRAIEQCLAAGVSFASINYRFREHAPLPQILRDTGRAIQFIRYKSSEWNVDKPRIASYGGSAGAGSSLWIAFHDDLADPDSDDPVLRESSRLAVVGANGTQCTYDFLRWREIMGPHPDGGRKTDYAALYGLEPGTGLTEPEAQNVRADCDMLGLLSVGDPPVHLFSNQPNTPYKNHGHYVHHPKHAIAIRDRCKELGIECVCILKEAPPPQGKTPLDMMLALFFKHLGVNLPGGD